METAETQVAKADGVMCGDDSQANEVKLEAQSKASDSKPPISYVCLIAMALKSGKDKKMTVSEIYKFFEENFDFFGRNNDKAKRKSWQNSIRHNLSLNDCFKKVPRDGDIKPSTDKKGNYWTVAPGYDDMFAEGTFKRRRRIKKTINPYTFENPFELLTKQTMLENFYFCNQHYNSSYQNHQACQQENVFYFPSSGPGAPCLNTLQSPPPYTSITTIHPTQTTKIEPPNVPWAVHPNASGMDFRYYGSADTTTMYQTTYSSSNCSQISTSTPLTIYSEAKSKSLPSCSKQNISTE